MSNNDFFNNDAIGNAFIGTLQDDKNSSIWKFFKGIVKDNFKDDYTMAFSGVSVGGLLGFIITILSKGNVNLLGYFIGLISAYGISAIMVLIKEFIETKKTYDLIMDEIKKFGYQGQIITKAMHSLNILNNSSLQDYANCEDFTEETILFTPDGIMFKTTTDVYLQRIIEQNNRISTENGPINVDIANDLYNLAVSYAITKDTNNSFTDMEILTYEIILEDLKKQIDELLKSKSL